MNALIARLLVYSLWHLLVLFVFWKGFETLAWAVCAAMMFIIMMRWSDGVDKLYKTLILDKKSFIVDWVPPAFILPFAVYIAFENDWPWIAGMTAVYWASGVESMLKLNRWKKSMQ